MHPRRTRLLALTAAVALAVAACGSGGTTEPDTIAPTSPPPSALPTSPTSATPTTSTVESTATTGTLPDGTLGLSPGGPWTLVDSAPGITTPGLVYELMPKLWVYLPTQEDIPNNITWTFNEADRPIIEAYLQARIVFFRATANDPIDLDDPGWAQWYTDGGASYTRVLTERRARHEILDVNLGVVLRPVVIGDQRSDSRGIVFDCMLDGGVWRLPDGSLGEGSTPGISPNGVSAISDLSNGSWKIEGLAKQSEACE